MIKNHPAFPGREGEAREFTLCLIFKSFYLFVYLFLAVLGLHCCVQVFSSCDSRDYTLAAMCGLLIVVTSVFAEHRV